MAPFSRTYPANRHGGGPPKATEPETLSSICVPYAHFDKGLPEVWQIVMGRMPPSYAIDMALRDAGYPVTAGAYYPCEKGDRPCGMIAYGTNEKGTPVGILVVMATFGNTSDKEKINLALRPYVVRVRDVNSHHQDTGDAILVDGMNVRDNQWIILLPVAVRLDALSPYEGTRGKIPVIAKASRPGFVEGVLEQYAELVRALAEDPALAKQVYFDVHHCPMDAPYIPRPGFVHEPGLLPSLRSITTFTSHLDHEQRRILYHWANMRALAQRPNAAVSLVTELDLMQTLQRSKDGFTRNVARRALRILPDRVVGRRPVESPAYDGGLTYVDVLTDDMLPALNLFPFTRMLLLNALNLSNKVKGPACREALARACLPTIRGILPYCALLSRQLRRACPPSTSACSTDR